MLPTNWDSSGGDRTLILGRGSQGLKPANLIQRGILRATPPRLQSPVGQTDTWVDAGPESSLLGHVPGSLTAFLRPVPPSDPATLGSVGVRISVCEGLFVHVQGGAESGEGRRTYVVVIRQG